MNPDVLFFDFSGPVYRHKSEAGEAIDIRVQMTSFGSEIVMFMKQ